MQSRVFFDDWAAPARCLSLLKETVLADRLTPGVLGCLGRDSNEPKLTAEDRHIFQALLTDFFPDVSSEEDKDAALVAALTEAMKSLEWVLPLQLFS